MTITEITNCIMNIIGTITFLGLAIYAVKNWIKSEKKVKEAIIKEKNANVQRLLFRTDKYKTK